MGTRRGALLESGLLILASVFLAGLAHGGLSSSTIAGDEVLVLTQIPVEPIGERNAPGHSGIARLRYGERARIVMIRPGEEPRVLTRDFHSAADPDISFDGKRMLFAGKREASHEWNVFEMTLDGSGVRQITSGNGNCRQPVYQGSLYTIDSTEPWHQITFVSDHAGEINEHGASSSTSLYSCRLDGSGIRRLTFNPSSDMDPAILPDGRLLFSGWQRSTLERGPLGRISLFASHVDGVDYALFAGDEGRRVKLMPAVTGDGLVVFVEGDTVSRDGAGTLGSVSMRRNLHSYRAVTTEDDGFFHSPSPLSEGWILVSRRSAGGNHAVHRLDPSSGRYEMVHDDPDYHDVQARLVAPRPVPDGRSSGVSASDPTGKLFCLNVHDSDLAGHDSIDREERLRVRVLEGIPRRAGGASSIPGNVPLLQRRFLGEAPVEEDGSFNIQIPANIPIQIQLLGEDGTALRSCGWIWVRNHETRGCIGCHEDGERTPENRFVKALHKPSLDLTLPPGRRRTVDFRRDVMPIISGKCRSCHSDSLNEGPSAYRHLLKGIEPDGATPRLIGQYVHPGRARTSPLIWHLLGRRSSRPWDPEVDASSFPAAGLPMPLTRDEIMTFVEWIDLGAHWDGIPADPGRHASTSAGRGGP